MPDAPDFSQYQLQGSRDVLKDLGELAAREDARNVWDRRGQVMWYDRFSGGFGPWAAVASGAGSAIRITATYVEWSGYAAQLIAGSDASAASGIVRFFQPAEDNRWGAECGVTLPSEFSSFRIRLWRTKAGQQTGPVIALDRVASQIKILTPGSVWQKIDDLSNPISVYGLYHSLKVVGDLATGKYVRLMYDRTEYDVSAYDMDSGANPDVDNQLMQIVLFGRAGFNDTAKIGHAIVTVGEP